MKRGFKKGIGVMFLSTMIINSSILSFASNKLEDIEGHWAQVEIKNFLKLGYVTGYEDGEFKPNNQITRAEFVKIINKVFNKKSTQLKEPFKDIDEKQWFYKDICIAYNSGYIDGYEDDTFRPNNNITREEALAIVSRLENMVDENIDKIYDYKDSNKISSWAKVCVEYSLEREYIKGNENNNINPRGYMTRAEAVAILDRVKYGGKDLLEPRGYIAYEELSKIPGAKIDEINKMIDIDDISFRAFGLNDNNDGYGGKTDMVITWEFDEYKEKEHPKVIKQMLKSAIGDEKESLKLWDRVSKGDYARGIYGDRLVIISDTAIGRCIRIKNNK